MPFLGYTSKLLKTVIFLKLPAVGALASALDCVRLYLLPPICLPECIVCARSTGAGTTLAGMGLWKKIVDSVSQNLAFFPPPSTYEVQSHADTGELYIQPIVECVLLRVLLAHTTGSLMPMPLHSCGFLASACTR